MELWCEAVRGRRRPAWSGELDRDGRTTASRRSSFRCYLAGGEVLVCVEPKGAAGPVGFLDCFGFFFSLLLRS